MNSSSGHAQLPAAVVLNFHKAEMTARCLASLALQVDEVVVVDNSESDVEFELLNGLLEPFRSRLHVVLLRAPKNLGFGSGVDHGIHHVSEAHAAILIINNDAVAHPDMVRYMQAALNEHNNVAIVAARSTGPTPSRLWYQRALGLVLRRPAPGAFPYLSGACLLVPRRLAFPALFDHAFFMYGEDVELCWRLLRSHTPLVLSEGMFDHTGSASSGMNTLRYEYFVAKGHLLLAEKLASGPLHRAVLTIARFFTLTARAVVRCVRFRSPTPLEALALALFSKHMPDLEDRESNAAFGKRPDHSRL